MLLEHRDVCRWQCRNFKFSRQLLFWMLFTGMVGSGFAGLSTRAGQAPADEVPWVNTGKYTRLPAIPQVAEKDPLRGLVTVDFARGINTVGLAIRELLAETGYRLVFTSTENCLLVRGLLFAQRLPTELRHFGPVTVRNGLQILIGEAWLIHERALGRQLHLSISPEQRHQPTIRRFLTSFEELAAEGYAEESIERYLVPFNIADFSNLNRQGRQKIEEIVGLINSDSRIRLVGHSHSRAGWATQAQALRRAEQVRQAIADLVPDSGTFILQASNSNFNSPAAELLHGVEVYITRLNKQKAAPKGQKEDLQQYCKRWDIRESNRSAGQTNDRFTHTERVQRDRFNVVAGSLRGNLNRLLERFDLRMGNWGITEGDHEYDWQVPYSYMIPAGSPEEALKALLLDYGIQPTLNIRDRSVDFGLLHAPVRKGEG